MNKKACLFLSAILLSLIVLYTGEGYAQTYTLTVNQTGGGSGTVKSSPTGISCPGDCTETLTSGKRVTLKAIPSSDSYFAGWSEACSGTKTCAVAMNSDTTVTATFEKKAPEISFSTDHLDFGDVETGKKAKQTLVITNTGTADLQVIIEIEGDFFSFSGKTSITMKSRRSYNLKVTFHPTDTLVDLDQTEIVESSDVEILEDAIALGSKRRPRAGKVKIKSNAGNKDIDVAAVELVPLVVNPQFSLELDYEFCCKGEDYENSLLVKGDTISLEYTGTTGNNDQYSGSGQVVATVYTYNATEHETVEVNGEGPITVEISAHTKGSTFLIFDQFNEYGEFPVTQCTTNVNGKVCETWNFIYEMDWLNKVGKNEFFKFSIFTASDEIEYGCGKMPSPCEDTCYKWTVSKK